MTPKKDEYMRGYGAGWKDAKAERDEAYFNLSARLVDAECERLKIPSLIAALKLCADNLSGCMLETDIPSYVILEKARAAISKAEGR